MNEQVLDVLLGKFQERIELLQDAVSKGNCTNFEEYKYACGQLRGLEAACMVIVDLKHETEEDDE